MKTFGYITPQPYLGQLVSQGTYLGTPFGPANSGAVQIAGTGARFHLVNLLIDWTQYGGAGQGHPPPIGSNLGVLMNLVGQGNKPPISRIEGIYIDNSFNTLPVYVLFADTGYFVNLPALAVACLPAHTLGYTSTIFCEGFDGVVAPLTRVIFEEHHLHSFIVTQPSVAAVSDPTIESSSHGNSGGFVTTFNATLPTGIAIGDTLLMFIAADTQNLTASLSVSVAGFSLDTQSGDALARYGFVFKRTADGTEGANVAVTVTAGPKANFAFGCVRIDHVVKGPQGVISAFNAASTQPDPPTLTPAWGLDTNLWLACAMYFAGVGTTVSANPSGFTTVLDEPGFNDGGSGGFGHLRITSKLAAGTSLNPGVFTLSGSAPWITETYAVGA